MNKDLAILSEIYIKMLWKNLIADKDKACEMIGVNDEHNNPETAAMVGCV